MPSINVAFSDEEHRYLARIADSFGLRRNHFIKDNFFFGAFIGEARVHAVLLDADGLELDLPGALRVMMSDHQEVSRRLQRVDSLATRLRELEATLSDYIRFGHSPELLARAKAVYGHGPWQPGPSPRKKK
jgi:hypothetical protein